MRTRLFAGFFVAGAVCTPLPASAVLCGTVLEPVRVTTTGLNFGTYSPASGDLAINGTVTMDCGLLNIDILPNFTISLSSGNSSTPLSRYMLHGATQLSYNLYTSGAHSSVWGDVSGGIKQNYGTVLNSSAVNYTVYGVIFGGQYVTPGAYGDSVIVTVSY